MTVRKVRRTCTHVHSYDNLHDVPVLHDYYLFSISKFGHSLNDMRRTVSKWRRRKWTQHVRGFRIHQSPFSHFRVESINRLSATKNQSSYCRANKQTNNNHNKAQGNRETHPQYYTIRDTKKKPKTPPQSRDTNILHISSFHCFLTCISSWVQLLLLP